MKKSFTLLLICLTSSLAFSQSWDEDYCLNFEQPQYLDHLFIGSTPGNLWQVGPPQKSIFKEANTPPNAIVTGLFQPYPINNHSVFTIKNLV